MEFSPLFKDRVYSVSYVCVCGGGRVGGGGGIEGMFTYRHKKVAGR